MKKASLFIIAILIGVSITGCWDMREINQRIFPYSVGVDKDGEGGRLKVTISYPNINAIGKNATQEDRIYIVATSADSVFEGARELTTRLPYPFYFKHLRVLIFGEELAKDSSLVKEILDGMARDFIINKKIRLLVADELAEDLLMFKPNAKRQEVIEGAFLSMLSKDKDLANYTTQTLTDFITSTDLNNVALMPKAKSQEDEIKFFGGCIFKDYQYIGDLNEKENRVVALLTGEKDKVLINTIFDGAMISFLSSGTKIEKKLIQDKDKLKLKMDIIMEGKIQEYILREEYKEAQESYMEKIEMSIKESFEKELKGTLDKIQKEYRADVLEIGEYIHKFHPKIWKEIEDDWDQVFSQMDIQCNIDIKLRRRGLIMTR